MKRLLILFSMVILTVGRVTAQGIVFHDNTPWADIQKMAEEQNKLIFIDCYTTWCGPCKVLARDVFPQKKVGDYFNFYDYIVTMRDRDGSDLSRYIHLKGEVNTYVPGDYTITYQITSPATGETTSKDLLVTVEQ